MSSVFPEWSFVNNYEFSRRGRLWVVWSSEVRLTPVFKTDQIITVSVQIEGEEEEFFCSFVYADNSAEKRKELWRDIKAHQNSSIFKNKEWILMGDFNEILAGEEHSRYEDSGLSTLGMREFEDVVQHCRLLDMGFQGPKFIWCNKRDDGIICKKLDCILVNESWLQNRTQSYAVFEAGGCSDHLRGRFHLTTQAVGKKKPFKSTNAVADMHELLTTVADYWKDCQPLFQSTSALFRFSKSLKALKPLIRSLSKAKLGELSRKVREAYLILCDRQEKTLQEPTSENMRAEQVAAERWQRISDIEEKMLKQRSKLHWLHVGDRNNRTFHNDAKVRESKNAIREIKCSSGNMATTQEEIKHEAERFFHEFLSHEPPETQNRSVTELQEILPFRCSDDERLMLTRPVTEEEIRDVVFRMPSNKSPGPDGFTTEFF